MTLGHRPPSSPRGFSGLCFAQNSSPECLVDDKNRINSCPVAYCYISKAKWFIPVYRLGEDGDLL